DPGEAGCGDGRHPGRAPEVAVPKQLAAGRGEQKRIGAGAGVVVEMLLDLGDDAAGQDDAASASCCLGRREEWRLPACLGELAADSDGGRGDVDVTAAECDELAPAQAAETGEEDHEAVARTTGVGEREDLGDGQQRSLR